MPASTRNSSDKVFTSRPAGKMIQRKLSVGAVNDPLEREANDMADSVMQINEAPFVQRKCSGCEEEDRIDRQHDQPYIQRNCSDVSSAAPDSITRQVESSRGKGQEIPTQLKSFMETKFATDFSGVRIHTGGDAIQMSRALNAKAFTVGGDIYFDAGRFSPGSFEGRHLLAHELTHTLQQQGNPTIRRANGGPYHPPLNTELNCSMTDSCSSISLKINYLRHTISSHISWDLANPDPNYPLGRHAVEIADLTRALQNCIQIAQTKCRNQPEIRIPVEQPEEEKVKEEAKKRQLVEQSPIPEWAKYILYGIMAGIALYLLFTIIAAIVACFATGVCEIGLAIGGLSVGAAAAVLFIISRIQDERTAAPQTA